MIRVLVAADSVVARAGLESIVARHPSLTVAGSSSASAELAHLVDALQPDVVLLEPSVHDNGDVVTALRAASDWVHGTALVILSDAPENGAMAELFRSGVRAVLPRDAGADEIFVAIEAAALGLAVLHDDDLVALLPHRPVATRGLVSAPAQALTPREIEVLTMLAEGLGNKQIAARLGISEHTVKAHVAAIFGKLGVSTRTEAATLGARLGLIML
ncbi:MAG TPA: response regulator transcription factor [Gemmatimonadaceae bacterium]|nr:response regulator transcription factor [Gemmatimonadaceae bacterium]